MHFFVKQIKSSALIQSGMITVLCLVVYWLGPISTWETNDDVFYNLLFSGQLLTSAPEPHAVFINFVLASFFSELYTLAASVPWYGYFHVTAILLSIWFLNYCYALTYGNDKLMVRVAFSLATFLPFLFLLQFTKTAAVLAVVGYLGLYLLNQVAFTSLRQNLILHAGALSFLVLSFALRKESFLLITVLCGLLMANALLKRNRALLVTLMTGLVLILSVTLVHKLNYGDKWNDFFALSSASSAIIDFNQYRYEENQKVYSDAGLSRNDYYFFKNWGYADEQVYSQERLDYILANATKTVRQRNPLVTLQGAVTFPARNYLLTIFGLSIFLLLVYRQQFRHLSFYVILPLLVCAGILAWQGRFPTRVSTGMAFFLPWAMLVLSAEMRKRWFVGVASIVALIGLAVPVYGQYRDLSNFANYRQVQNQDLHRLGEGLSSKSITLVTLGASFPYEGFLPFESPSYLEGARIVWLCGMNQSPVQKRQLEDNGIADLFASLSDGTVAYIVLDASAIGMLKQYLYEHYRKNVNVKSAFVGQGFMVYRLIVSSR